MNLFNDLIKFKNSKEWIEFEKYYSKISLLEQIDFFRFEDANTNFLASLLRENNPYGLGDIPLRLLCELIAIKDTNNKYEFIKNICMSNADISNIDIKPQAVLPSGKIDLIIKFNVVEESQKDQYLIALEAKLDSTEHDSQCKNYRTDIEKLNDYKNYKKLYVYLGLSDEEKISDEEHYIKITYQDLIDYVYEPCSYKTDNNKLSTHIDEYITGFSSLYDKEKINIKNIPITNKAKDLTLAVWDKNKDILKHFIDHASTDENAKKFFKKYQKLLKILFINITEINDLIIEKEYVNTYDTIKRIAQNIRARNKLNKNYYNDSEFIFKVFKDIISKAKITEYNQLKEVNKNKFIYSFEEYEQTKAKNYHTFDYYGKLSIPENTKNYYYYSHRNTPSEIQDLIELIKANFPEYYNNENLKRLENINELLKK